MRQIISILTLGLALSLAARADSIPNAISTDPPADPSHPAKMTVLHIPTHGVSINGLVYSPSGAGPHPTLIICHGLPGNEKNLDLAQAVRRAGWNAVTFNYRGSWGSPGKFSFAQNLEDARAVLAYLRVPKNAADLQVDTKRLVLAGHSMGGWVTALDAAQDQQLAGAILISAADMGSMGDLPHPKLVAMLADDMETLNGVTPESEARELHAHAGEYKFQTAVAGLSKLPLLVLTSDDGLAPAADALVTGIKSGGGTQVTTQHVATDHGWSDHRIALQSMVIGWLATLP